ncbi:MAG: flagellar motor switch protein FliN, partial [Patescibacteria group bacterium]
GVMNAIKSKIEEGLLGPLVARIEIKEVKDLTNFSILQSPELVTVGASVEIEGMPEIKVTKVFTKKQSKAIVDAVAKSQIVLPSFSQPTTQHTKATSTTPELPQNFQQLLDVPMEITVELGRTEKHVQELLKMGPGNIIELDRLAGELVDVLVNGKLFAKAGVVVVDENFGVRIADIISREERISIVA